MTPAKPAAKAAAKKEESSEEDSSEEDEKPTPAKKAAPVKAAKKESSDEDDDEEEETPIPMKNNKNKRKAEEEEEENEGPVIKKPAYNSFVKAGENKVSFSCRNNFVEVFRSDSAKIAVSLNKSPRLKFSQRGEENWWKSLVISSRFPRNG